MGRLASSTWDEIVVPAIDRAEPPAAIDDEMLAQRAKQHPAAFAPLYQKYVRPIYAYCYQRLGNRELAEDATSVVFTKALAAMPKYRADSFRGWIYTIARNVIADTHRRRPHAPLEDASLIAGTDRSPEETALATDADQRVRFLLSHLTNDQRDVIELDLAGLIGSEIAQVLGRRQGAIRAAKFRAYQKLRTLLTTEEMSDAQ
ncbi:MAG: RNA polymerase sigma factor [Thermomicrobiales bacterium]